ncbi:ATP-dependent DNA helicase RecG [Candidatus Microgenomates bacterium]|nr:ATP-dependent DNA helicase RecG [Candidatus Microgenomates bacterium]
MKLVAKVSELPFIGPVYAKRLARLNIKTLADLLYHFPYRYHDFSIISPISRVQLGEIVTIRGKIISIKNIYTKNRKIIQQAIVEDDSGQIEIIWFNQRYIPNVLPAGSQVSLAGKIGLFNNKLVMESPDYEKITSPNQLTIHTGRLVPIYPETSSIPSKWLRSRVAQFLPEAEVEEFLPLQLIKRSHLPDIKSSLQQIHFPQNLEEAQKSRERFAFEELLLLHLSILERKNSWQKQESCYILDIPQKDLAKFMGNLPFVLTNSQRQAVNEILADLTRPSPMNRLLEGDVGSGKTVVAAIAAYVITKNNLQTIMLAPTQILAQQHFDTLSRLLNPYNIKFHLITGGKKIGHYDVVVGTHALFHQKQPLDRLGLVVIDEQHKFGVEQRAILLGKNLKACLPHVLTMTATPIPRTVALTLYGDLDLSVLTELPAGRKKIKTWVVPPQKRDGAYQWISKRVKNGEQVFIVCPLIEESEIESMKSVRAATAEFNQLKEQIFPDLKLGLLHGKLKANQKDEVIKKFRERQIDILVATPVVEVGIDISNATVMMVEAADRFGLAQLHQLRGRVGRRELQSYCLLFTESTTPKTISRLHALEEAKSGSELAELDLKLRGPGEVFGTRQHGFPELKVANFGDLELIKKTKEAAQEIFPSLSKFPKLKSHLKTHLVVAN